MMGKTNSLLTTALAALLLTGCSQNEIMQTSPDAAPAVGFSVYATAQTRGTITDNNTTGTGIKNTKVGFGVLAYYTGQSNFADVSSSATTKPNFMYNQLVKWNATPNPGAWEYSPVKYWPNTEGDKISFFAYAPYENAPTVGTNKGVVLSTATATGYPTLTFTVKANASEMIDLVATDATQSVTGTDKTMNLEKTTGKVPFNFNHVLTKVNFQAKLASDLAAITDTETKVFVKKIELLGTSAATPASANSNALFYKKATYKFEDGKWDYTTSGTKAEKQAAAVALDAGLFAGVAQTFGSSGNQYTTNSVAVASLTTPVSLFKTNQSLFLIPPTNDGIPNTDSGKNAVRVLITYDVVTIDDKLDGKKSVIETKAVASLPVGTMEPSKAYIFTFTIGLESVKVDTTVDNWTNGGTVALPSADAVNNASAITTAIGTLNTAKGSNPNCNYFVVNITSGAIPTTLSISSAPVANFVSGDKIEIKATTASSVSSLTLPSDWKRISATGSMNYLIIQKN